jgi:predicted anti-sigma-YlaC factor YlaD
MGCEPYREAMSAWLDGEAGADERAATEAHLAVCAACRRWLDGAARVTRLARLGLAVPVTGVAETVLAAAPGRARARLVTGLRVLLGVLGGVQILVAVAQIALPVMTGMPMTGRVQGASPGHLLHEVAAWNLAVGAAFVVVAWRRGGPRGVLPILTAFVAALALLSAEDLVSGAVAWSRLASHLAVLAGYAVVVALSRSALRLDDPPAGSSRDRAPAWRLRPADDGVLDLPTRLRGQPTAHTDHRAA